MEAKTILTGLRVLIVEDEMLVALLVEDALLELECVVVGPIGRVAEAVRYVAAEPVDAAVLDINVAGEKAYPVAEALEARGVPFLFVSGYGQAAIPHDRPQWRVCAKPFRTEELLAMLAKQVHNHGS